MPVKSLLFMNWGKGVTSIVILCTSKILKIYITDTAILNDIQKNTSLASIWTHETVSCMMKSFQLEPSMQASSVHVKFFNQQFFIMHHILSSVIIILQAMQSHQMKILLQQENFLMQQCCLGSNCWIMSLLEKASSILSNRGSIFSHQNAFLNALVYRLQTAFHAQMSLIHVW